MFCCNMSSDPQPCSVGLSLGEHCHKLSYTKRVGVKVSTELSDIERELVTCRVGLYGADFTIFFHHEKAVLSKYSAYQTRCCNPFELEGHTAIKSLRVVNLEAAKNLRSLGISVKPGEKLCPTCKIKADQKKQEPTDSNENDSDGHDLIDIATRLQEVNSSFMEVDVRPVKLHAISKHRRVSYGKGNCLSFILD